MKIIKKPIAVSVALIIAGFSIQMTSRHKTVDVIGGCLIFIGLIMFSISLHEILKQKPNGDKI